MTDPNNTLSRRDALKSIAAFGAVAATGTTGGILFSTTTPAGALTSNPGTLTDTVLVTVFLRGAADGLNMVIPRGDEWYSTHRPTIGLQTGPQDYLDGYFSLNADLAALRPMYDAGELAFIHAIGSTALTRSHFAAMDNMDTALAGPTGWLWRANQAVGHDAPFARLGIGTHPNPSLSGTGGSAPSVPSVDAFVAARQFDQNRRILLQKMYDRQLTPAPNGATLAEAVRSGFDVLETIESIPATDYAGRFPNTSAGAACYNAARLINADVGIRAVTIDVGGNWDHHIDEMREDRLPKALRELGDALAMLRIALGPHFERTTTLVVSEFGRTAKENGAAGTDHGSGTAMMVFGPDVNGGQVLLDEGRWPGLAPDKLRDGQDLLVTTDFRVLLAEATRQQYGEAAVAALDLPAHVPTSGAGIFRGSGVGPLRVAGEWVPDAKTNLNALRLYLRHEGPRLRPISGSELSLLIELRESAIDEQWQLIDVGQASVWPAPDVDPDTSFSAVWTSSWLVDSDRSMLDRFAIRWATSSPSGGISPWTEMAISPT